MLKKTLSFILAISMIFGLIGCTKPAPSGSSDDAGSKQTENVEDDSFALSDLFTEEVTFPAEFFTEQDMNTFDADAYAEEQGFLSAKVNDDGSITVTMTNKRYNEVLDETAASIEDSLSEYVGGETTGYIKGFTHNDDFTEVTMKVDKAAYEDAFDFTPLAVSIMVALYHTIAEIDFHFNFTVMDNDTGEIISTTSFPVEED